MRQSVQISLTKLRCRKYKNASRDRSFTALAINRPKKTRRKFDCEPSVFESCCLLALAACAASSAQASVVTFDDLTFSGPSSLTSLDLGFELLRELQSGNRNDHWFFYKRRNDHPGP
jgi:hypothetical protein